MPDRGPSLPARIQRIQSRGRSIPNRVTAMTRCGRSPLMGTGHPRLTTTVDPEHSKPAARSEHGPRTRDQRVRKDGAQQHGQTPPRGLDPRLDHQGVPVLVRHPARQRTTTHAPDDKTTTVTCRVRGPCDAGLPRETAAGVPATVNLALAAGVVGRTGPRRDLPPYGPGRSLGRGGGQGLRHRVAHGDGRRQRTWHAAG